ncbi:hypothetical protein PIB30_028905 [Stylosanthes scabra]|uniref:Uncharacterized protein n=1 Tax=Stylosanthes scabra TaxID=79078 RepID=A0ABU6Z7Y9_9FABA|nr:hypothetical protein [Stylosanthes scabra]
MSKMKNSRDQKGCLPRFREPDRSMNRWSDRFKAVLSLQSSSPMVSATAGADKISCPIRRDRVRYMKKNNREDEDAFPIVTAAHYRACVCSRFVATLVRYHKLHCGASLGCLLSR